jgi:CheY-like chemotaxis protein
MWSMGVKILLADDSPTVHKVIKIILKDESHDIIECARETELVDKLRQHAPQIVFLDFNFSETKTGYELSRLIKAEQPNCKILVMYGTFDTVDEAALVSASVDQHVVKPFDTAKFTIQVRNMAENFAKTPSAPKASAEINAVEETWSVRETVERKTPDIGHMTHETVTRIEDDLEQWGMMIPGVIGKSAGSPDLPPVIGEEKVEAPAVPRKEVTLPAAAPAPQVLAKADKTGEFTMPSAQDLEYPDMDSGPSLELEITPSLAPKSKLVSLNELSREDEAQADSASLLELTGMEDEEGDQRLADQIQDEVEEDLWSVDAFEEPAAKLTVVKDASDEEPKFGAETFDESLFAPLDATPTQSRPAAQASMPADLEGLKPMLQELIREAVAEYCRQHVDKVAWEVIPDLAENLIKSELRKISDKVTRDI